MVADTIVVATLTAATGAVVSLISALFSSWQLKKDLGKKSSQSQPAEVATANPAGAAVDWAAAENRVQEAVRSAGPTLEKVEPAASVRWERVSYPDKETGIQIQVSLGAQQKSALLGPDNLRSEPLIRLKILNMLTDVLQEKFKTGTASNKATV